MTGKCAGSVPEPDAGRQGAFGAPRFV